MHESTNRSPADRLPLVAAGFACGIGMGLGGWAWLGLAALAIGLARVPSEVRCLALALAFGAARGGADRILRAPDPLAALVGHRVVIRGIVCEPEVRGTHSCRFVIEAREVAQAGALHAVRARILVMFPCEGRVTSPAHWTQEVVLVGVLERPPEIDGFDYAAWLAGRDVFEVVRLKSAGDVTVGGPGDAWVPVRWAAGVRRRVEAAAEKWLPPVPSALTEGVVLAEARGVPDDVAEAFQATGTYHVLVTAGIHVAFVSAGCIALLGVFGVGGARAALLTVPVVMFFALIAGASPSIVRAAIMGAVGLVAHAVGRISSGRRALALAVVCMTASNPRLVGEAGFQMSVACVAGILHLAPLLRARLGAIPARLRGPLAVSLATQIMIAPLSARYFGHVSISGIVANLVVVPLCELLLALGLALSAVGGVADVLSAGGFSDLLCAGLARPLALAAWADASLVVAAVRFFRRVPLCIVQVGRPEVLEIVLWYVGVWAAAKHADRRRVPEDGADRRRVPEDGADRRRVPEDGAAGRRVAEIDAGAAEPGNGGPC